MRDSPAGIGRRTASLAIGMIPMDPASLASDVTRTVLVDARGRIWVGTNDAGIDVLDPASGRIEHLRHDPGKPDSLSDDQVFTLALDRSGAVWAGTAGDSIAGNPSAAHSCTFARPERSAHSRRKPGLGDHRGSGGSLWVGTFDGGLDRMDPPDTSSRAFATTHRARLRSRATMCAPFSRTTRDIFGSEPRKVSI
jgi:streptogramin lyase